MLAVDRLAKILVLSILFMSLVLPTAFPVLKLFLLLIPLLLLALFGKSFNGINIKIFNLALAFTLVGFGWSVYGYIVGNPGALRVLTVMVVYPVLFVVLGMIYQGETEGLKRFFIFAALVLMVLDLAYVFCQVLVPGNLLSQVFALIYDGSAVVDSVQGYIKFTLPNVTSMIFLIPFLMCRFMSEKFSFRVFIALMGLCMLVLLSGRRALLVTVFAGPIIAYLLTVGAIASNRSSYWKIAVIASVFMMFGFVFYSLYPDYLVDKIASITNFEDNSSNLERVWQFNSLMEGFWQYPAVGQGAGAVASYVRTPDMPWAYELFYVSMLFQYGVIGFSMYVIGVAMLVMFLMKQVRLKGRASFEFYYLAGFISFLLATATNPYLAKFDYMWVIFIPVAMLNYNSTRTAEGVPL